MGRRCDQRPDRGEKEESSGRTEHQDRETGVDGAGGFRGWDGDSLGKREIKAAKATVRGREVGFPP